MTVFVEGAPKMGVAEEPIVVNDATGAIVSATKTGSDGKVDVDVPEGGLVAVYLLNNGPGMQAVVDPPDGITLRFPDPPPIPPTQLPPTTFHVSVTGYPPDTTTLFFLGCGDSNPVTPDPSGTTTVDVTNQGCIGKGKYRVLAIADDNHEPSPLSWGQAQDLYEAPGSTIPVSITLDQTSFVPMTVSFDHVVPSAGAFVDLTMGDTEQLNLPFDYGETPDPNTWAFELPDVGLDVAAFGSVSTLEDGSQRWVQFYEELPMPANITFNAAAIASVDIDSIDVSDPSHPVITWSAGKGPQGVATTLTITDSVGLLGYTFTFASNTRTSFRVPDVPCWLPAFEPTANKSYNWRGYLTLYGAPYADWAGYFSDQPTNSTYSVTSSCTY